MRPEWPAFAHDDASITTSDGVVLHARRWRPSTPARGLVVLAHGLAEHLGRYRHVAEHLAGRGWAVAGADHRGHGRSAGRQGDLRDLALAVDDLDAVVAWADVSGPVVLLGHSMGSLVVLEAARRAPQRWHALVVSGVALDAGHDIAAPAVAVLRRLAAVVPTARLTPPLDVDQICSDPAVTQAYRDDPLVDHGRPRLGTARAILDAVDRIRAGASGLGSLPILFVHGRDDQITPVSGAEWLVGELAGADVTLSVHEGLHEVLNGARRHAVLTEISGWLEARTPPALTDRPGRGGGDD